MRKIRHFFLTTLAVLCSTLTTWAAYSGTPAEPTQISGNYADYGLSADFDGYYVISTAAELYGFAELVNSGTTDANGVLTADIVVNENVLTNDGELNGDGGGFADWTPIRSYAGTFNGNCHIIMGLYYNANVSNVGLFSDISGAIINLGIVDSYFCGKNFVGGIVANVYGTSSQNKSTIINCYNTGTVIGNADVGGIAGYTSKAEMTGCYNVGSVIGNENVGGITGYKASYVTITRCFCLIGCTSSAGGGTLVSAEDVESGKLTFLLNDKKSTGSLSWYQTLGIDAKPILDNSHKIVYASLPCMSEFNNIETKEKAHDYDDLGFCVCGDYHPVSITRIANAAAAEGLGLGSEYVDYYAISNAAQLYAFAYLANGGSYSIKGVLTSDIVVNENVLNADGTLNGNPKHIWTPIGTEYNTRYRGTFDGNNHFISGLYYSDNSAIYVGLFGLSYGTIKNVGIVDSYFNASEKVGAIAGYIESSAAKITNCYNTGTVLGTNCAGGICGYLYDDASITHCSNSGMISGNDCGGICGYTYTNSNKIAYITNCYNIGTVTGSSIGGICGYRKNSNAYVLNCFNTGSVNGSNDAARGIVGNFDVHDHNQKNVSNCYSLSASSTSDAGGGIVASKLEFASGKITYLLNGSTSEGDLVWYQNIGTDYIPVFDNTHSIVYASSPCPYSNNSNGVAEHNFNVIGQCSQCGEKSASVGTLETISSENYANYGFTSENYSQFIGYYAISNAIDLYAFAEMINNGSSPYEHPNAVLIANITVNENVLNSDGTLNGNGLNLIQWTPIGSSTYKFNGIFNGNGHIISGLYCDGTEYIGLFGYAGTGQNSSGIFTGYNSAIVTNVGIEDSYFCGSKYLGGICGYLSYASILNCYNAASVIGSEFVGGVFGLADGAQITSCYNIGKITNGTNIGNNGSVNLCCYLENSATTNGRGTPVTRNDISGGKLTYLLNGSKSVGELSWYQNLGTDADSRPVWDNSHSIVYASEPCHAVYSNTANAVSEHHYDEFGQCTACGEYTPATLVTNDNYESLELTSDFVGYYAISTVGQLYWFANQANTGKSEKGVLIADIVVNRNVLNSNGFPNGNGSNFKQWTPIGTSVYPYSGIFNGNGHVISGLYCNDGVEYVGLIGYASFATILNVGIEDSYFSGGWVGGICGYSYSRSIGHGSTIKNCYTTVNKCILGYSDAYDNITNCFNVGKSSMAYDPYGRCNIVNCYYLEDGIASSSDFASGKIAYLLNSNGDAVWHQDLYSDEYPLLNVTHNLVTGYIEVVDDTYTVVGDVLLATNYEIAESKTLNVPAGTSLTTTGNAIITNNGILRTNGTLSGNNLAGNGTFITNRLSLCSISNLNESYVYKSTAYTLEDGLSGVAVNTTILGKTFTLDATISPSYTNNRNVGTATISWTNNADENDVLSGQFEITPKTLAISNIKAENKVYDGNTTTTVSYTADVFRGDDVTFGTAATFDNKNAGTGKQVTFNYTKSGADAANYAFANATGSTTANIEPRELAISSVSAASKEYDGNTATTVTIAASNIVSGDVVTFGTAAAFADKNVGTNKTVNFTYTKNGADAANYAFAQATGTATAAISARELTLSNFVAADKVYDGTVAGSGSFSDDRVSGDVLEFSYTVEFDDENANTDIDVYFSDIEISGGADKDNYYLDVDESEPKANADITPVTDEVVVTISLPTRTVVYNGTEYTYVAEEGPGTISFSNELFPMGGEFRPADPGNFKFTIKGTNVGEYSLGWNNETFVNASPNFTNVSFSVTDGKLIITPKTGVVVTITENSGELAYNTEEQSVEGYTYSIDDELGIYSEDDFAFSGNAVVAGTTVGTYPMELSAADFSNTNANFADVRFVIVDGALTITKAPAAPNKPEAAMETRYIVTQLVALPENWKWADEQQALEEGSNVATANYVGADKGNYVIESVDVTITRLECLHNEGNEVLYTLEPTCTHKGYTGNMSCKLCGVIYEMGDSIPALGHDFVETVIVPTCTAVGYTEHLCNRCQHIEYSDTVAANGHKADSVVFENMVAATCTVAGSYDSVVYCSVCRVELSRDVVDVPAAGHKADSVVIENIVRPTLEAAGSYDSVIYCSVCKTEISRKKIDILASAVAVSKLPNKVEYKQGEKLDVAGGKLTATYTDKSTEDFEMLSGWVSGFDSEKVGKQTLTVKFETVSSTLTTTFDVTVKEADNTAIDEDAAEISIYAYSNIIVVEAADAITGEIAVFDVNGRMVCKTLAAGTRTEIQMPRQGLYIVRVGNQAKRVVIK